MDDFTLLKALQAELIATLEKRRNPAECTSHRELGIAKIHRLRIQIQEIMLRIERKCDGYYYPQNETWHD